MGWDLYRTDLPEDAKSFLSVLGSCGDERQATVEAGVTENDVRIWSRLDEFVDHRRKALEHFESWRDWKPVTERAQPGEQTFIPLEQLTPRELWLAGQQNNPSRPYGSPFGGTPNPGSFPTPSENGDVSNG